MLKLLPQNHFRMLGSCAPRRLAQVLAALFATGLATTAARAENWQIVPQISLSETYTDNVALAPSGSARNDWVTDITPGLRIDGQGARASIFVDYHLHELIYGEHSNLNNTRQALDSAVALEAIEDWLFIDGRAVISQQNKSAFGAVSPDLATASPNRSETGVLQLSPYIRGQISDIALYQLRYNGTTGHSRDDTLLNTQTSEWIGIIKSAPSASKIGWSLNGNDLSVHNDAIGRKEDARIQASLIYELIPQLRLSVADGHENTDFAGSSKEGHSTPGFGFEWSPNERTQVAGLKARRFFGESHSVILSHRAPLTAWKYSDTRDIVVLPTQLAANSQSSIYGLLYDLMAASTPDPFARSASVRSQLEQNGIPLFPTAMSGFLTSQIFVNRRREAAFAFLGTTNTFTLSASQDNQQSLGMSPGAADSFAASSEIRQRAVNGVLRHRLTPQTSLTVSASRIRSEGLTGSNLESKQTNGSVILSTQLGPKTFASAGIRHVNFDSSTLSNFRENAVMASLSIFF